MKCLVLSLAVVLILPNVPALSAADKAAAKSPREALQVFNDLIGTWKGTGIPEGTREEKNDGLWIESLAWVWQFKDKDVWLQATFTHGKHFTRGELRYLPAKELFQLTLVTTAKETLTFTGRRSGRRLILERSDATTKQDQRLAFTFLRANRFLYAYEVKAQDQSLFTRLYRVGATKKGVAFAEGDNRPECVVSGGLGTIKVRHNGKLYYVCCTGCRREFQANPEKYIKEYEKAKKAKEK